MSSLAVARNALTRGEIEQIIRFESGVDVERAAIAEGYRLVVIRSDEMSAVSALSTAGAFRVAVHDQLATVFVRRSG